MPASRAPVILILTTAFALFSMFFGAGNLIFPPQLGVDAGWNFWPTFLGFVLTGVVMPVLAVTAVALWRQDVRTIAGRAGGGFGLIFALLIYLSLGAFYVVPRTAAVSFESAVQPFTGWEVGWGTFGFTAVYFAVVLALSWKPGSVVDYIGKILTPVLLILLVVLIAITVSRFWGEAHPPSGAYEHNPVTQGLLDGYFTMDSVAALAFAVLVIRLLMENGMTEPRSIAKNIAGAAVIAGTLLGLIYLGLMAIGLFMPDGHSFSNGAQLLSESASLSLGLPGRIMFGAIVTLACLTTGVGLLTASSEFFHSLFPKVSYHVWAVISAVVSTTVASFGLDTMLTIAGPMIGVIYPPALTLIILCLIDAAMGPQRRLVWAYRAGVWLAFILAILSLDILKDRIPGINQLPFAAEGLGWLVPVVVIAVVGIAIDLARGRSAQVERPVVEA